MKAHENPFSASAVAKLRYRLTEEALHALAQRACATAPLCAIVGPEGTGKTTLLEDLEAPLRRIGRQVLWLRLNRESSAAERQATKEALTRLRPQDTCLLDGGEVFSRWEWWQLKRQLRRSSGQAIATLHSARGFPVLHQTKPDWGVVQSLVRELSGPDPTGNLNQIAQESFHANGGNAREVFRTCYWSCVKR